MPCGLRLHPGVRCDSSASHPTFIYAPLAVPRHRCRDRMCRIPIQREGHPNLTVTGFPKEIPDVEAWMAERAAAAPVAPAKAE